MSESQNPAMQRPRRFHFEWLPLIFVRPRHVFRQIAGKGHGVWQAAILTLSVLAVALALATGWARRADPLAGGVELPPDFEYYSPEQQAQFMQAAELTSGPMFVFVYPSILALLKVWLSWLILGGVMHLVLTLLGGRGSTLTSMNITAWAMLPLALRSLVRIAAVLISGQAIAAPGVSGFIAADAAGAAMFFKHLLALVDIYLIWMIVLLIVGARAGDASIHPARAAVSIPLMVVVLMLGVALLGFVGEKLSNLTIMRPFFF